jgi:membrane protein YqaA with SNARE-associated domain
MRRTWEWFRQRAAGRHAEMWLAILSFTESSVFLIPPDVLLIAMLSAGATRWKRLALLTTVASLAGAVFGYVLGYAVFESIGRFIVELYGLEEEFATVGQLYTQSTFFVVLIAAFTPIPFKVFVLAGGFFSVPFMPFMLGSLVGRGARFYLVAFLAHRYGPRAAELFIRNFNFITVIAVVLLALAAALHFDIPARLF